MMSLDPSLSIFNKQYKSYCKSDFQWYYDAVKKSGGGGGGQMCIFNLYWSDTQMLLSYILIFCFIIIITTRVNTELLYYWIFFLQQWITLHSKKMADFILATKFAMEHICGSQVIRISEAMVGMEK